MIGSGLKKMAVQNGMKIAKGVAYGSLQGYAATLFEGSGYKQIVLTTRFSDPAMADALRQEVNRRNIASDFRVKNLSFAPNGINIVFNDNPGTMKKIEAFIAWFMPLLTKYGADKVDVCNECGQPIIDGGTWILRDSVAAFHLHSACAQKVQRTSEEDHRTRMEKDEGTYLKGALGALGGAVLGAVVWALVLMMGYVASIVGLLIGWLADKGYNLLHGKQGKAKIAILIAAVIVGVVLGTLGAYGISITQELAEYGIGFDLEYVMSAMQILFEDPGLVSGVVGDVVMGLLFAGLGVGAMIVKANKEVSAEKITVLQ